MAQALYVEEDDNGDTNDELRSPELTDSKQEEPSRSPSPLCDDGQMQDSRTLSSYHLVEGSALHIMILVTILCQT